MPVNQTNPLADGSRLDQIVTNGKKFYEADMQSRVCPHIELTSIS